MQKLKVLAHTVEPIHKFYKEQFSIKSNNFIYSNSFDSNKTRENTNIKDMTAGLSLKSIRRKLFSLVDPFDLIKVPIVKPVSTDCDLIHMAQVIPLTDKPWVVDFEEVSAFAHYNSKSMDWPQFEFLFKHYFSDPNCKAILPWTNAAKKGFEYYCKKHYIGREVTDKLKVVYPFVSKKKHFKRKQSKTKRLLFLGKQFYLKGGLDAVLAFIELKKTVDCELTIVSTVPQEIIEKYSSVKGLVFVDSSKPLSDSQIENFYKNADLFIFPTHMDTLGFVLLEAMSYGLPIVSVTQFAVPEMVTDNGLLIENPFSDHENFIKVFYPKRGAPHPLLDKIKNPSTNYIKDISNACKKILCDKKIYKKMSKNSLYAVEKGKFSRTNKEKKLSEIYSRALM